MYNPSEYFKIINDPLISKAYERGGKEDMLKKGPAGFPKDFEFIEEIKYKHYIFSKNYENKDVIKSDFAEKVTNDYKGLYPLVDYLNHSMSFTGND